MQPGGRNKMRRLFAPSGLIFAGFGSLFLVYGVYALALPTLQPSHWDFLTSDQPTIEYIASNFRWMGLISIGFGVVTISLLITGFRSGEKLAWFALLYFPILFLLAIPFTWPGMAWIPFLVLSLVALILPARAFFNPSRANIAEEKD